MAVLQPVSSSQINPLINRLDHIRKGVRKPFGRSRDFTSKVKILSSIHPGSIVNFPCAVCHISFYVGKKRKKLLIGFLNHMIRVINNQLRAGNALGSFEWDP